MDFEAFHKPMMAEHFLLPQKHVILHYIVKALEN